VSDDSEVINLMKSYYGQINATDFEIDRIFKLDGFKNGQDLRIERILKLTGFDNGRF